MWYPTHSTAYYVAVTGQSFTEVSCQGFKGKIPHFQPDANRYQNPFDSEVALFRTSEGGSSRMSVCWGMHSPRWSYGSGHPWTGGPTGLVHGELGCMHGTSFQPAEDQAKLPDLSKPQLPPGMEGGARWFTRLFNRRVRHCPLGESVATDQHRLVFKHDRTGHHRPPVSAERRGAP